MCSVSYVCIICALPFLKTRIQLTCSPVISFDENHLSWNFKRGFFSDNHCYARFIRSGGMTSPNQRLLDPKITRSFVCCDIIDFVAWIMFCWLPLSAFFQIKEGNCVFIWGLIIFMVCVRVVVNSLHELLILWLREINWHFWVLSSTLLTSFFTLDTHLQFGITVTVCVCENVCARWTL